jgi:hypothetical protein
MTCTDLELDIYGPTPPGIANARLLCPPLPITDPDQIAHLDIRRHQRLGGILN